MEKKRPTNVFQEVHKKSQAARDKLRKKNEHQADIRKIDAEKEAVQEGFDRPATDTIE
jgi:hypothetical protein